MIVALDEGLERGDAWGGSNAAWIILNRDVDGLGAEDAAIRAAKAAATQNEKAAANANGLLAERNKRTLTRAAQTMLNDMGASVDVDGAYGGQTRSAIEEMAAAVGLEPDMGSAQSRLVTVAQLYWRNNPYRVDLY